MGRWAQAHRRGSVLAGETRRTPVPPAPVIDRLGAGTPAAGIDIASQAVPADVGRTYNLYVQSHSVGAWVLTDVADVGDGPPYFPGDWTVTDSVRVTEVGNGTTYVGESAPSNIEAY